MDLDLDEIVGKTVTRYVLSPDRYFLRLWFSDGMDVILEAYGEGDSDTWFASIDSPEALLSTILAIGEIQFPTDNSPPDGNRSEKMYGLAVKTQAGYVVIEYRNSSNGYYGGNLILTSGDKWQSRRNSTG